MGSASQVHCAVDPMLLEQHPRLEQARKQLPVQQLIAQPRVEALSVPVLPGTSRGDVQHGDSPIVEPTPNRRRDELRAVVRAEVGRSSLLHHQPLEHLDHLAGAKRAAHLQRQCSARELVEHDPDLQRPPIHGLVTQEVVAPHMIRGLRPMANDAVCRVFQPSPSALYSRHPKSLLAPDPLHALVVHPPAVLAKQRRHAPAPESRPLSSLAPNRAS